MQRPLLRRSVALNNGHNATQRNATQRNGKTTAIDSHYILDYVERESNSKDGDYWEFKKILSHSLLPGKKVKDRTGIELQVV